MQNTPTGALRVAVTTASGAYPVPQAQVTVTTPAAAGDPALVRIATTDNSGNTPPLPLLAPSAYESRQPDGTQPAYYYDVRIDHPDYLSYLAKGVAIFPEVTATLSANLEPTHQTKP